jgi:actin-related protein
MKSILVVKLCFISQQFNQDMKHARQTRRGLREFDREFLLPDFVNTFKGAVQLPMPLQRMMKLKEEEEQQLAKEKIEERKSDIMDDEQNSSDVIGEEKKADKPNKKRKRQKKNNDNADKVDDDEQDADIASDVDSDEETEQQRLQRLKQMREQEQKRREAEAKDRQALALSVERFAIPEVLFTPSDLGLECGGIADAIVESINACDATLRAAMYHNVLLVGGNAKIPGYKERVEMELRKLAPVNYVVRVFLPDDPVSYAWEVSTFVGYQEYHESLLSTYV